jgi:hypothetical protein
MPGVTKDGSLANRIVNWRFSLRAAGHGRRRNLFQMEDIRGLLCRRLLFSPAFLLRLRNSSSCLGTQRRRLPSCEPREVTEPAAILLGDVPPSEAAIALSMRPLSAFKS